MITWILASILVIFILVKRFTKDGRVEGYPLGMPRGTVRAIITLMVVSFPFTYLLENRDIPSAIINSIFILVAFYFEARKSEKDLLNLIKYVKNPQKQALREKEEKKPLYLPKYSVRAMLVIILIIVVISNFYGPNVAFIYENTLLDILIIISFYFVGSLFRSIALSVQKKKIRKQMESIPDYQNISKYALFEKIAEQEPSFWKKTWKSIFSIIVFIAVSIGLMLFTLKIDYTINIFGLFEPSLREALLLLINVYYGFRD